MWLRETASSEIWNGLGFPYSLFFCVQGCSYSVSEIVNPGCTDERDLTSMNLQFLYFTSCTKHEKNI
jgi:hypothetical protein